eukprot:scaffold23148_cov130-Isochrysis_galbana.AAC.3
MASRPRLGRYSHDPPARDTRHAAAAPAAPRTPPQPTYPIPRYAGEQAPRLPRLSPTGRRTPVPSAEVGSCASPSAGRRRAAAMTPLAVISGV